MLLIADLEIVDKHHIFFNKYELKKEVEQQVRQKVIPKTAAEVARQRLQQSRTSSDEAEPEPQPQSPVREARCDTATKHSRFNTLGHNIDQDRSTKP